MLEGIDENQRTPSPVKEPEIRDVFANCRIFVEVRSGNDDRSVGIRSRLTKEGIQVDARLNKTTTHVIFKDGLLSTYKQAKKQGAAIVNLLWVDTCLKQKRLVDTDKFKISNQDRYENPELYKKVRSCRKSMQFNLECFDMNLGTPNKTSHEPVDMNLTSHNEKQSVTCNESTAMTPATPRMQKTTVNCTAMSLATPSQNPDNSMMSFVTPTINTSGEKKKIVFNSLNKVPGVGRRSIVDIALQRITDNCNRSMNSIADRELLPTTPKLVNTSLRSQTLKKRKILDITSPASVHDDKENIKRAKELKTDKKSSAVLPKQRKQKTEDGRHSITQYFKPTVAKKSTASAPPKPTLKRIVCTNMHPSEKRVLHDAIVKLGGVVEDAVTRTTTHVVSPTIDRTMNILRGVVRACLIVDVQWIHASLAANKFVDATVHQHVISDSNRFFERSVLGSSYKNSTFTAIGLVYLHRESFDHPDKKYNYLREVIELCDGRVTDDVSKATIIVNDGDTTTMKKINPKARQVKSSFIFDSAMSGKFV